MKIGIAKGHNTPFNKGASGQGFLEDDLVRAVGDSVIDKLRKIGHEVIDCTPNTAYSQTDSLQRRCDTANSNNVELFVEIHMNAFSDPQANGTEVFCNTSNANGKAAAQKVLNELVGMGYTNRGVKDGMKYYVISKTNMTAILVEICFITNKNDMHKFTVKGASDAITKGIAGMLPVEKPVEKTYTKAEILELLNNML